MDRWQAAAVEELKNDTSNGVIIAPTSAGKGTVGRTLLEHDLKNTSHEYSVGLWVTPLKALEHAESHHLSDFQLPPTRYALAMTPEKALNWLKRNASNASALKSHKIVSVIVDEAHCIGDYPRGATLDAVLSILLFLRKQRVDSVTNTNYVFPRLLLLSATVSNAATLADWLDARLFATNARPVPLSTHVVMAGDVYTLRGVGSTQPDIVCRQEHAFDTDAWESVVQLVQQTVHGFTNGDHVDADRACGLQEGGLHSCLLFVSTRADAENAASALAERLPPTSQTNACTDLVSRIASEAEGNANAALLSACHNGVGVHHAGLLDAERSAVEKAFLKGVLLVLVCTTTLAAGVNLPARTVIMSGFNPATVSSLTVRQMCGRAGRRDLASKGDAFFVIPHSEGKPSRIVTGTDSRGIKTVVQQLFGPVASVRSPLSSPTATPPALSHLALTAIGSQIARSNGNVRLLCLLSFGAYLIRQEYGISTATQRIDEALQWLHQQGSITGHYAISFDVVGEGVKREWILTTHGSVLNSCMLPLHESEMLESQLKQLARIGVPLHKREFMVALAVPSGNIFSDKVSASEFLRWFESSEMRDLHPLAQEALGLPPRWRCTEVTPDRELKARNDMFSKILVGWLLRHIVDRPENIGDTVSATISSFVSSRYSSASIRVADVLSLQQSVSQRCDSIACMCDSDMELQQLGIVYGQLRDELAFGATRELHSLLSLPVMSPSKARALHERGITTPAKAARASEQRLALVLKRSAATRAKSMDEEIRKRWAREIKHAAQEHIKAAKDRANGLYVSDAADASIHDRTALIGQVASGRATTTQSHAVEHVQSLKSVDGNNQASKPLGALDENCITHDYAR